MPLALTLRLDDATAARLDALRLAARDPGDPPHHGYPAHLTLAVLPDGLVAEAEAALQRATAGWQPMPLRIEGLAVFPGPMSVLWAAPVVTSELLRCQAALCTALAGLPLDPHYLPCAWVPHVTLREGGTAPVAEALGRALTLWDGPIAGRLDRVELVNFHPAQVLRSRRLGG